MRFRFLILAVLFASIRGFPATLTTSDPVLRRGQATVAPLVFSAEGQRVSALQFDVVWSDDLDVKLVVGDQLRGTSKLLYTVLKAPHTLRCLIAGGNDLLPEGELLKAFLIVDQQASSGTLQLQITNPVATDPDGNATDFKSAAISVAVDHLAAMILSVPMAGILNAASFMAGPLSPGEIVTLFGSIPAGATVFVNAVSAPILYTGRNQVNAVIPFGVDPEQPARVELHAGGGSVNLVVPAAQTSPAIFTQGGTGAGPGSILNENYTLNTPDNPAPRASTVMLFGTGFGAFDPPQTDGRIVESAASVTAPVIARIGNRLVRVTYAGAAPGLIAGVTQINIEIPLDIEPSPSASLVIQSGLVTTPPVSIAIR